MTIHCSVLFLFVIFISESYGTFKPTLEEPTAYFENVTARFRDRVLEYGLSNLPVIDVELFYNTTGVGRDVIGAVYFEDGFVMDLANISANSRQHSSVTTLVESAISGRIEFEDLLIYHDLRAELETGKILGSVVLAPTTFSYTLRMEKQHNNDTIVPTLTFFSWSTLSWDLHPDNVVTNILRRQYTATVGYSDITLLTDTAKAWLPTFQQFIEEIVADVDYPNLVF